MRPICGDIIRMVAGGRPPTMADLAPWLGVSRQLVSFPVQPFGQIFGARATCRERVIQIAVAHRLGAAGASEAELRAQAAREIDERAAHGDPYGWVGVPSAINGLYDDEVLQPGDMIITGSPPGNGSHYGRFLRPGDVLYCEISGLGAQRTVCRTAAPK